MADEMPRPVRSAGHPGDLQGNQILDSPPGDATISLQADDAPHSK
jgi:hypothetical protein